MSTRIITLLFLTAALCPAPPIIRVPGGGGGGGVTEEINDDFVRADADALGGGWTEIAGDTDIDTNRAEPQNFGVDDENIYTSAALTAEDGYIKVTITWAGTPPNEYGGVYFRSSSDGTSRNYISLSAAENTVGWGNSTDSTVDSAAMTLGAGTEAYGITWTGAGTDIVVRVWQGVTADAPTAADTWDGGAADFESTADPANPVDGGDYVGFWAYQAGDIGMFFEEFIAGRL